MENGLLYSNFLAYKISFIPGEIYHVYNRGNNKEIIFREETNYEFFLKKMHKELESCCELLAYVLMPNHYHFLIYIPVDIPSNPSLSRKIGTLQSSYTQAFNKRYNRTGSLFQPKLKRKCASEYAEVCFHYIHQNPVKGGLCEVLDNWKFSSYGDFLNSNENGLVNTMAAQELLDLPKDST